MTKAATIKAAILLQVATASPAIAQSSSPDAAIDRADALADRGSEIGITGPSDVTLFVLRTGENAKEPKVDKPKRWTLSSDISFSYSDNAAFVETGKLDAAHLAPNIKLKRELPLSKSVMLSIELRTDFDIFTDHNENDTTAWTATTLVAFGDSKVKIAPYLSLANRGLYSNQWGPHLITTHSFGIGAGRKIGLSDGGALGLDLSLLRREATILTSEAYQGQFSVKYDGPISTGWAWSVGGRLRYLDYTGGAARTREDFQLRATLGVTRKFSDSASLSANVYFLRNWSNVAAKSYTNIDVGPTLTLGTKF